MGTVTAYGENTASTGGGIMIKGHFARRKKSDAYLAVDIRVVNATTGEIDFSRTVEGRASGGGVSVGVFRGGFGGALSQEKNTPAGKAIPCRSGRGDRLSRLRDGQTGWLRRRIPGQRVPSPREDEVAQARLSGRTTSERRRGPRPVVVSGRSQCAAPPRRSPRPAPPCRGGGTACVSIQRLKLPPPPGPPRPRAAATGLAAASGRPPPGLPSARPIARPGVAARRPIAAGMGAAGSASGSCVAPGALPPAPRGPDPGIGGGARLPGGHRAVPGCRVARTASASARDPPGRPFRRGQFIAGGPGARDEYFLARSRGAALLVAAGRLALSVATHCRSPAPTHRRLACARGRATGGFVADTVEGGRSSRASLWFAPVQAWGERPGASSAGKGRGAALVDQWLQGQAGFAVAGAPQARNLFTCSGASSSQWPRFRPHGGSSMLP